VTEQTNRVKPSTTAPAATPTPPTGGDRPSVLFLCVHNAGRSQMAAGWLERLGRGRLEVYSAGSDPAGGLNPAAVAAMAEVGIDIANARPKRWTEELTLAADVVVTMGCGDSCPVAPGARQEDWPVDDPAGQPIEVVRRVRDDIRDRVVELAASLGVAPVTAPGEHVEGSIR